jgi:TPR repeat protein
MLKGFLAGLVVTIVMASGAVAGPLDDASLAYDRGDYATALKLWKPLAEQGVAEAEDGMGVMYAGGRGVPQDKTETIRWWRLAGAQGNGDAQSMLGVAYSTGNLGVPKDNTLAYMWFSIAGKDANRDIVAKDMTPEQIAEAQRKAREWKPDLAH